MFQKLSVYCLHLKMHKERDRILNHFKYLGVVFDNFSMTWKAHTDYVCKKVALRVSILGRVRSFVTKETAVLVHNASILPLFHHCDIAWSNPLQQDIDRLQRLQNRSARITLSFFYKNVAFPAQADYSHFSADFRLKIFLYYS